MIKEFALVFDVVREMSEQGKRIANEEILSLKAKTSTSLYTEVLSYKHMGSAERN